MAIIGIEHVNIRTACLPETIHFYRDILGMTVAPPPGRSDLSDGAWVYGSDGSAVLHIGDAALVYPGETQAPATWCPGRTQLPFRLSRPLRMSYPPYRVTLNEVPSQALAAS